MCTTLSCAQAAGRTKDAVPPRPVRPAIHWPHQHVHVHGHVQEVRFLNIQRPMLALRARLACMKSM